MNLRWLYGNFADPQYYQLERAEQLRLSNLAHKKYLPFRRFAWWTSAFLIVPVLLVYKVVMPAFLKWLELDGSTRHHVIGIGIIIVLFWIWAAWIYRILYRKPMRLAMREAGYEVCVGCGYMLKGLTAEVDRCPECGWERE